MLAIFKREMRSYFTSPVGYMFCAIFFAVSGFLFMLNTVQAGENSNYAGYFSIILFLFIIIIPLLTMKLVSEETKMKTDQLIMTAPITLADIVLGKYLEPALTTIDIHTEEMGRMGLDALMRRIGGQEVESVRMTDSVIVERDSVACIEKKGASL